MFEEKLDVLPEELLILVNIRSVYRYIVRNKDDYLIATINPPIKDEKEGRWKDSNGKRIYTLYAKERKYFNYIKWSNTEPVSINRLLGGNYRVEDIK